jgi:glycosyltransferase A (GT-A) superfamily protein (DUF2064 family)
LINTNQTAVLVFSRFANEEAKQKKYSKHLGNSSGIKLADQLINYTLKQAKQSSLPVYPFFSDDQRGNDFGARLSNAIEDVFHLGYKNVIIVGSDSPSVTSSLLLRTEQSLRNIDLVLAPATDGGVFLIGMSRKAYYREQFQNIPWLSSEVFDALQEYAKQNILQLSIDASGEDIDNFSSLLEWVNNNPSHQLYSCLRSITQAAKTLKQQVQALVDLHEPLLIRLGLRGPPPLRLHL